MAENQQAESVATTADPSKPNKHRRIPMTKEQLEARRQYLAQIREEIALEAEEETLQGARLAVRTLKALAKNGRDERAKYSAAAKILDIVLPKSTGPLVNLSFGGNFISHLGLPPPPDRPNALPGPIRRDLLPEPQIMPRRIAAEETVSVTKIAPESDKRGRFSTQASMIDAGFRTVEDPPAPREAPVQPPREIPALPPIEKLP
jgi:hypothetical protein